MKLYELMTREQLVGAVVDQIVDDVRGNNVSAIPGLLETVGVQRLVGYLDEDTGITLAPQHMIVREVPNETERH